MLRSVRALGVPRVIVGGKFDSDLAMHPTNDVSELWGDSEWGVSGLFRSRPFGGTYTVVGKSDGWEVKDGSCWVQCLADVNG